MSVEAEIAQVVAERGWYGVNVFDGDPPFIYSIGLMQTQNHPELVVFGLETRAGELLLGSIIQQIRAGENFASAEVRTVRIGDADHRIGLRRVDPTRHPLYLGYAMGYCRYIGRWGELEAMQVFWPDSRGKFPFEAGFDSDISDLQPRLDIPLTQDEIDEFERQFGY